MSTMLYKPGKQKKMHGFMVDRLDAADERVGELCSKGWARTPYEAYNPRPVAPVLAPIPLFEPEPEPEQKPKKKKKKKQYRRYSSTSKKE